MHAMNRNDYRGPGSDRDRWRGREDDRRGGEREHRSFGDQGRFNSDQARYGAGSRGGSGEGEREPWRRDRYGSLYDQDRAGYGSGYDRERGGYGGGQEYGMEGGRSHDAGDDRGSRGGGDQRETWRPAGGAPYGDLELNARNRGVEQYGAPHDYAYHPEAGHEFDSDYTRWRDEQLRNHDRDYQEWRKSQHQQYDDDYRRFRAERRDHFGKTFHAWRAQQNLTGGATDTHIEPGKTGDTGVKTAHAGGFASESDQPSGRLEPRGALTPSPTLTQGAPTGQSGGQSSGAGQSQPESADSEFGKEPPQVQAAADGGAHRGDDADRKEDRPH
jgi:hypothetical protein